MKLTIVTVCYKAEKTIGRCIESVLHNDCTDYQYLIIDGASPDDTVEIAKSYAEAFEKKNISYTIVSEKDTGIYNAMNKAIALCQGEWVLYLNSDDKLFNEKNLSLLLEKCTTTDTDVVYGDVEVKTTDRSFLQKPRSLERLKSGTEMPFCHQSTLTRTSALKRYHFDESYRIIADIDMYLRMYEDHVHFAYYPICVSVFSNDGVSQTNRIASMREGKRMLKKHGCYSPDRIMEINARILWYRIKRIKG